MTPHEIPGLGRRLISLPEELVPVTLMVPRAGQSQMIINFPGGSGEMQLEKREESRR